MKCQVCGKIFTPPIPNFNLFSQDHERAKFCSNTCQAIGDIKHSKIKISPESRLARRMKELEEANGKNSSAT